MQKEPDLIKLIQINFSKLSKGQKIIAEYIMSDYDKAAFMTAANLGKTLGISESTVVRFASRLGYSGYRELQEDLQELIKSKLTTVQRLSIADSSYDNSENILSKVMERDIDNIEKTILEMNDESFKKAIDLMLKGNQIYIVGLRSSAFLAGYLGFYLNFLLDNVNVVDSGPSDLFEQILKINSKDVLIVITYPRYSKRVLEVLDYAKEKKASIISITDSMISPAVKKSDVSLIASSNMISFVDSLVAPMSLINAFIISLGMENRDGLKAEFEELEKIWERYGIYDGS